MYRPLHRKTLLALSAAVFTALGTLAAVPPAMAQPQYPAKRSVS